MILRTTAVLGFALFVLIPGRSAPLVWAQPQTPTTASLQASAIDDIVNEAMKTFDVPGMAIAVVKDGQVIVAKGYGKRRVDRPEMVDNSTLFNLASNTKVFTAAAIGLLVEDGKLKWDSNVVDFLPWFKLSDPEITRQLTVMDLLTHRVLGPNVGDLLFMPATTYTRREIAEHLQYLPIGYPFRTNYNYAGAMFLVAGELIEAVSGRKYEQFVGDRLLKPIGMTSSAINLPPTDEGNFAAPHDWVDGSLRALTSVGSRDNAAPAAGLVSNATDMAKWLAVFLNRGRTSSGARIYSEATQRVLETMVTPEPLGNPPPQATNIPKALTVTYRGYALGLHVQDYRGKRLIMHGGQNPGFISRVAWLPEQHLGVAMLTNASVVNSVYDVLYSIIDRDLGVSDTSWIDFYGPPYVRRRGVVRDVPIDPAAKPSLPLTAYAGQYSDPWYGEAVVAIEGDHLVIRFPRSPDLIGDLAPTEDNSFMLRWRNHELGRPGVIEFSTGASGAVSGAKITATVFSVVDFQNLALRRK